MSRPLFIAGLLMAAILATLTGWNILRDRDLVALKAQQDAQAQRLTALENKILAPARKTTPKNKKTIK